MFFDKKVTLQGELFKVSATELTYLQVNPKNGFHRTNFTEFQKTQQSAFMGRLIVSYYVT